MIDPDQIHSLTDFQRNAKKHIQRLRRTGKPTALTLNGQTAAIIQDPAAYAKMADLAFEASEMRLLERAIKQAEAGKGRPIDDVIRDIRRSRNAPAKRRKSA